MRFVGLLLAVAVVGGLCYFLLKGRGPSETSMPKETLDQVRAKTGTIEKESQERADELLKKTQTSP